jgi:2-dehydro-3-deoxyphosphogluconate aldolase/(4S)-4-hydroxy-2-oxoglutarate aldolase
MKQIIKDRVLGLIREYRLIPVVRVSSREDAMSAARGIILAGLPLIEITSTVPDAFGVISELSQQYRGKLEVGAGTIFDSQTCQTAIQAGASFIVSPLLDLHTIEMAREHEIVCIAGALTSTEAVVAWRAGADFVKIFPCGSVGGSSYIRALKGPFPQIEFVPSSGVNLANARDFLDAGSAAVAVGEPIFNRKALPEKNVEQIAEAARQFMKVCKAN